MSTPSTPLKTGWCAGGIPGYRPGEDMYCDFSYENLPPIDETQLDGTFRWLAPTRNTQTLATRVDLSKGSNLDALPPKFVDILFSAWGLGLTLPASFIEFMTSPDLWNIFLAYNPCWIGLPDKIVPFPAHTKDGYVIRFMADQQDCRIWYLYLRPGTLKHGVLVSTCYLDPIDDFAEDSEDEEIDLEDELVYFCAPSFEAFLYRYHLEDKLYTKLDNPALLTEEDRAYLEHYKQHKE